MGCVKASWVSRTLGNSNFSLTTKVHGWKCHKYGARTAPSILQSSFYFGFMHYINYVSQRDHCTAQLHILNPTVLTQLTSMLHEYNHSVQWCTAIRDWLIPKNAASPCLVVIYSDCYPTAEHVLQYYSPQSSKIAKTIRNAENGILWKQDVGICRSQRSSTTGSEHFSTTLLTHCSHNPLSNVFFTAWYRRLTSGGLTSIF